MTLAGWEVSPQDAAGHLWDVIVIGTGAGGATAGFNLARSGRSVLFVERGKLLHRDPTVAKGVPFSRTGDPETELDHGWWPGVFHFQEEDGAALQPIKPPVGAGAGGSTARFGAVMDRFRPQDFTPRRFFPGAPDASLPDAWPVSYEEMIPFYERAESLYRVRGTQDPLASSGSELAEPPPPSDREIAVFDALKAVGLNPYRLHCAVERVPGCIGCPGMLCPHACRNDAARICLYPALDCYGAKILSNCRAVRLEEKNRVVEQVICERDRQPIALRARAFVLAANAFLTPALLQRSANERFPDGLANSSGLVGRNLMLHANNHLFVGLKPPRRDLSLDMNHGLSLNDFYIYNGMKLGNFHAHAVTDHDSLVMFLAQSYRGLNLLPGRLLSQIASATGSSLRRSWMVFAAIVEDLPYPANRVIAKPGAEAEIVYTYRYPDELRYRAQMMSDGFTSAVAPVLDVRPMQPVGALNGSHVCGTCRFGDDPRTSVLDRDNRAHDLDNLFVLDASFFPSSGGINPSLTIVANSLRASEVLAGRL